MSKVIVLMTDGQNKVYTGAVGASGVPTTNDDVTTAQLCDAIKAQNITIYIMQEVLRL